MVTTSSIVKNKVCEKFSFCTLLKVSPFLKVHAYGSEVVFINSINFNFNPRVALEKEEEFLLLPKKKDKEEAHDLFPQWAQHRFSAENHGCRLRGASLVS